MFPKKKKTEQNKKPNKNKSIVMFNCGDPFKNFLKDFVCVFIGLKTFPYNIFSPPQLFPDLSTSLPTPNLMFFFSLKNKAKSLKGQNIQTLKHTLTRVCTHTPWSLLCWSVTPEHRPALVDIPGRRTSSLPVGISCK